MSDIRVYEPACSTCRNLFNLLQEMGVDFDKVDYHVLGHSSDGSIAQGSTSRLTAALT